MSSTRHILTRSLCRDALALASIALGAACSGGGTTGDVASPTDTSAQEAGDVTLGDTQTDILDTAPTDTNDATTLDAADTPSSADVTDVTTADATDMTNATDASDANDVSLPTDAPCAAIATMSTVDTSSTAHLTVSGESATTIADPSVFYPPGAPGGALAYSSVPAQNAIATHVAVSNDAGASWTFVGAANMPATMTVTSTNTALCPSGSCTGQVINETPTIVYDPSDPDPTRVWKLFTHRYLVMTVATADGGTRNLILYQYGHIAMYTAMLPAGPWSAPTVALGWPSETPFSSTGATYVTTSDPGTSGCGILGEPGVTLAPDGSLHIAAGCVQPPFTSPTIDIVLLRSTDHGASWHYVSTPVRGTEGPCFGAVGGSRMNAADLFVAGGTEYLIATPEGTNSRLGCVVFPFGDSSAGTLARDAMGSLIVTRWLDPTFATAVHYAGACTASPGASALGYTMSDLTLGNPPIVELATGIAAP